MIPPFEHEGQDHCLLYAIILMIVGVVGALLSLLAPVCGAGGIRHHRTTVDDGQGHVTRRDDTYRNKPALPGEPSRSS